MTDDITIEQPDATDPDDLDTEPEVDDGPEPMRAGEPQPEDAA